MRKFTFRTSIASLGLIAATALTPAVANADTQDSGNGYTPGLWNNLTYPVIAPINPTPIWGLELAKKLAD